MVLHDDHDLIGERNLPTGSHRFGEGAGDYPTSTAELRGELRQPAQTFSAAGSTTMAAISEEAIVFSRDYTAKEDALFPNEQPAAALLRSALLARPSDESSLIVAENALLSPADHSSLQDLAIREGKQPQATAR